MPYIHIRSLPFEEDLDISVAVRGISRDFSRDLDVDLEHVTVTWELYGPGHYARGGETCESQPSGSHPVLVDLLVPDSNTCDTVARMLTCVASSIAEHSGVSRENVFVNARFARSGMVFDSGEVETWEPDSRRASAGRFPPGTR
jgi:hypothetical protein